MKTRQKGNRARLKAIEYYRKNGYLVDTCEKTGRFIKVKDLFGLFDIICLGYGTVILVQVTCNTPHSHKKYLEFAQQYSTEAIFIDQMVWYDYKGFKKFKYYPNNIKEVVNIGD